MSCDLESNLDIHMGRAACAVIEATKTLQHNGATNRLTTTIVAFGRPVLTLLPVLEPPTYLEIYAHQPAEFRPLNLTFNPFWEKNKNTAPSFPSFLSNNNYFFFSIVDPKGGVQHAVNNALEHLNHAIAIDSAFWPALVQKSILLSWISDWDGALESVERVMAMECQGENYQALQVQALHSYLRNGDTPESICVLRKLVTSLQVIMQ